MSQACSYSARRHDIDGYGDGDGDDDGDGIKVKLVFFAFTTFHLNRRSQL